MKNRIKKGDLVQVIAGKHRPRKVGEEKKVTQGRVLKVLVDEQKVIVEGVNKVKRHQSPKRFREAGIIEKEAPIHISNVMLVDPTNESPTRVTFKKNDEGKKVRIAVKSGAVID